MMAFDPLSVLVPAGFAGLVAVGVTLAIERWGGRAGGLIGTLPSTIVPAAIGIALQGDATSFRAAMYIAPVGMFIDAAFLYMWRAGPARLPLGWSLGARLTAMTVASLSVWLCAATLSVTSVKSLEESGVPLVWVGVVTTACIAIFGLAACAKDQPAPKGLRKVGMLTLLCRGLLAAGAIGAAVFLAAVGGPLAAGVAAVFPAIFLTTMVSLWVSQGEAVQAGAVGPMMLGSTSVAVFCVLAAWTIPTLGVGWGTVSAWLGATLGATLPAWLWLHRPETAQERLDSAR